MDYFMHHIVLGARRSANDVKEDQGKVLLCCINSETLENNYKI